MYKRTEKHQKIVHSPDICLYKGNRYLTFYECAREGWTQKVVVLKKIAGEWRKILTLKEGSGNPVFIPTKNSLLLAYSQFREEWRGARRCTTLWREYTDCVIVEIGNQLNEENWDTYEWAKFRNLIPRIGPIKYEDKYLLPFYNERFFMGHIMSIDDDLNIKDFSIIHEFGKRAIQPTLYMDGNTLVAQCRNYNRRGRDPLSIRAIYDSKQGEFMIQEDTGITNFNESLLLFNYNREKSLVFGSERDRTRLALAPGFGASIKLNDLNHGCYPNWCDNENGTFSICFTEYQNSLIDGSQITIKTFRNSQLIKTEHI